MSSGKVLLGVLTGVAIGAALGILFAPDKGSKTRKKIYRKTNEYAEGLGDRFEDFLENLTEQFETVKEDIVEMAEKAKSLADEAEKSVTAKHHERTT